MTHLLAIPNVAFSMACIQQGLHSAWLAFSKACIPEHTAGLVVVFHKLFDNWTHKDCKKILSHMHKTSKCVISFCVTL